MQSIYQVRYGVENHGDSYNELISLHSIHVRKKMQYIDGMQKHIGLISVYRLYMQHVCCINMSTLSF